MRRSPSASNGYGSTSYDYSVCVVMIAAAVGVGAWTVGKLTTRVFDGVRSELVSAQGVHSVPVLAERRRVDRGRR